MYVPNRLRRRHIRILSIDGGGIRGLVPAMVLADLEARVKRRRRNYHLHRVFDVVTGTSTGALIALGLTAPAEEGGARSHRSVPLAEASRLVELYREKGPVIFPAAERSLKSRFSHAFRPKYDAEPMRQVFDEIFGERTLRDLMTQVVIPSYDTVNREPRLFKHRYGRNGGHRHENFYLRDVARAAAAAPTYFPPAKVVPVPDSGHGYSLVDGGIYANNPSLVAYIEARKLFPRARRFVILSLGTGIVDRPYPYEDVCKWGYIDWMSSIRGTPLLDMMMDGQSDNSIYMLERLPGVELHRFDFHLERRHAFMDDTTDEHYAFLTAQGQRLVRQHADSLEYLAESL